MADCRQLAFNWERLDQTDLKSIFNEALDTITRKQPRPEVEARFYPYAGLSSTIRLRNGRVYVRVSDLLSESPREVLYALACMLVSKLYRVRVSPDHERAYREYAARSTVHEASEQARRRRGFKVTTSPNGRFYDLNEVFDELNQHYFDGGLKRPILSWSKEPTSRVLGHHDNAHSTIVISRTLDSRRAPKLALEFVLFHEMLHMKHPARTVNGRRVYHSAQFRADERRFARFEEASALLDQLARSVRRKPRRTGNGRAGTK